MTCGDDVSVIETTLSRRNHASAIGAHIEIANVSGLAAELLVSLHIYPVCAVVEIEVVHIGRSHINLQGVGNLLQLDLHAARLFAVDGHHELRIIGRK